MIRFVLPGLVALAALAVAPAIAQPTASQCKAAYDEVFETWVMTDTLQVCADAGVRDSEALVGMLYWSAASYDECGQGVRRCTNPGLSLRGLDPKLTTEHLLARGRQLIESAASKGNAIAQNELGLAFLDADSGVAYDPVAARRWLMLAVDGGEVIAAYNLARIHFGGYGVPKSQAEGERLLRHSAERGYEPARCSLYMWLSRKEGGAAEAAVLGWTDYLFRNQRCRPDMIMQELF